MRTIVACLLGSITAMALASGGIPIDSWEFWVVFACLIGMCLNVAHD